ncbi:Sensory/regulatory protein RpfC [Pandoraea captiosa]|uniref:histidine kinase n=1 Tax=Pandoraea captiosa TaxID=2508302 RepID=A0A5E4ZMH2_9BURK|nr:sensor histidine kinase [Pandoraea captiosa]VVE61565.1 Sensory/regulatory protein RpfC [Pandoraea captiosa]
MNLDKFKFQSANPDAGRYGTDQDSSAEGCVRNDADDVATFRLALVHELRAPLQVLQGHLDAMIAGGGHTAAFDDRTAGHADAADAFAPRGRLGNMRNMLDVLAGAVDDVLQLGHGEIAQLPLREAVFEVRACLDTEVDAFRDAARAKALDLTCDIANDVPVFLWGDAGRLRQIVRTLVDNALKYTMCGGVAVRVSWGQAMEREAESQLTIHVTDTGPGIPAGMENAVFAAFARADAATKGSGLGLWIARQWARRLGGVLCAEPSSTGARLRLSVPFAPFSPFTPYAPSERSTGIGGNADWKQSSEDAGAGVRLSSCVRRDVPVRVPVAPIAVRAGLQALVVDDHAMNRKILGEQLTALGCHVATAQDLSDALVQWVALDVDVVLTDVHLDGVSGLALAKTLHALAPMLGRREPAVFAVTGSVVEARAARDAGIDDVLTKPVSRHRLAQTLSVRWPALDEAQAGLTSEAGAQGAAGTAGAPARRQQPRTPLRDDPHARRMMRDEMAKDLARFRRLIARRREEDIDAAQALLHRMRGACRMFGDPVLTARCEQLAQKLECCRAAVAGERRGTI